MFIIEIIRIIVVFGFIAFLVFMIEGWQSGWRYFWTRYVIIRQIKKPLDKALGKDGYKIERICSTTAINRNGILDTYIQLKKKDTDDNDDNVFDYWSKRTNGQIYFKMKTNRYCIGCVDYKKTGKLKL